MASTWTVAARSPALHRTQRRLSFLICQKRLLPCMQPVCTLSWVSWESEWQSPCHTGEKLRCRQGLPPPPVRSQSWAAPHLPCSSGLHPPAARPNSWPTLLCASPCVDRGGGGREGLNPEPFQLSLQWTLEVATQSPLKPGPRVPSNWTQRPQSWEDKVTLIPQLVSPTQPCR